MFSLNYPVLSAVQGIQSRSSKITQGNAGYISNYSVSYHLWSWYFGQTNLFLEGNNEEHFILLTISGHVVLLCVIILVFLFLYQRYGTSKVSFSFSPIMLVWFVLIASIGLYNMIKYYPPVLKAISPHYIYIFFAKNKRAGWEQLGTVVLCITGKTCNITTFFFISTRNMQYHL